MPKRRRLLHRPWVQARLGRAIALLVRLLAATGRWRLDIHPDTLALLHRGEPAIAAFWHGRLLLLPPLWQRLRRLTDHPGTFCAMVSAHGDGELMATALVRLGVPPVRGSTGRSGAKVLRAALAAVEAEGASIAVAVDGPRGPDGHVHPGCLYLARATGLKVVPVSGAVRPHLRARSWDRLLVPWPFSRGVLLVGAPMAVPRDADEATLEACRRQLAASLHRLTEAADAGRGLPETADACGERP